MEEEEKLAKSWQKKSDGKDEMMRRVVLFHPSKLNSG